MKRLDGAELINSAAEKGPREARSASNVKLHAQPSSIFLHQRRSPLPAAVGDHSFPGGRRDRRWCPPPHLPFACYYCYYRCFQPGLSGLLRRHLEPSLRQQYYYPLLLVDSPPVRVSASMLPRLAPAAPASPAVSKACPRQAPAVSREAPGAACPPSP